MHPEIVLKKILRPAYIVGYLVIWILLYQWGDKATTLFFYIHRNDKLDVYLSRISDFFGTGKFYIVLFALLWLISVIYKRFSLDRGWFKWMTVWLCCTYA